MNALRCMGCATVQETGTNVCGACGSMQLKLVHVSAYWFDLAVSYGYPRTISAAVLIKDFYDLWDKAEYETFTEFMQAEVLTA